MRFRVSTARPEHLPKERHLSVYLSKVGPLRERGKQSVTAPRSLAGAASPTFTRERGPQGRAGQR